VHEAYVRQALSFPFRVWFRFRERGHCELLMRCVFEMPSKAMLESIVSLRACRHVLRSERLWGIVQFRDAVFVELARQRRFARCRLRRVVHGAVMSAVFDLLRDAGAWTVPSLEFARWTGLHLAGMIV